MSSFLSLKNVILACSLSRFWIHTDCMQLQRVFLTLSHDQTASILHFPSGFFVASNSCCMSKPLHGAFPTSFICSWHFNSHLWLASAISHLCWTCLLNLPTEMNTPSFFCILAWHEPTLNVCKVYLLSSFTAIFCCNDDLIWLKNQ